MKSTKSLLRRMAKLEVLLPARRTPTAEDERFADAFLRLVERMDSAHGAMVMADMERGGFAQHTTTLTMAVAHYVLQHLRCHTPLELPTAVAAVYAQHPNAWVRQECADCGYELPNGFEQCPLCGGPVGMIAYAFYAKHGYSKYAVPTPAREQGVSE
jgi:hypothetical protein